MYECVDKNPDSVPGSDSDTKSVLVYHVEASCNQICGHPIKLQKLITLSLCVMMSHFDIGTAYNTIVYVQLWIIFIHIFIIIMNVCMVSSFMGISQFLLQNFHYVLWCHIWTGQHTLVYDYMNNIIINNFSVSLVKVNNWHYMNNDWS